MSRLEMFLRELKLTPKQAKSPFSPNTYRRRKSSINSLRRKKKTKPDTLGKIKKVIQEKRQEERQAQQLVNNEIAADREEANQLLLNNDPERIAQVNQLLANPITLQEAREVIRTEKGAEDKITRQARAQKRLQADEQEDINEMDIGQQTPQTINGEEVTTQVEIDLGCNEVEDQDEDDENQDNEICNIPLPFIPQQQDDGIDTILSRQIRRIGSRRAQRTTQFQTIQSRIFDIVHESYSEGKLQAEVKNTSFKGNNQNGVITIYKTDNNLIKRIKNTFNEYVYTDDSPITLNDTDILSFLVYGVEKTIKGETKRYKVEKPKPKLKRVVVGGDNTDKIDKTIGCYTDGTRPGCSFFNDLTTLYGYFNTAVNKDDLIKSVILWFDTHHDFKAGKEGRYPKAENVWNAAFGRETFITWYAKKFFTPEYNPNNLNQLYSFSNEAEDRDNTNVLTPVVDFNNRGTAIPTLLYNISQTYLQNRLFEKTVLLHYIVHNFAVTPPGVLPVNYSTTLLRDILYVHRQTYNNLLEGIEKQVREINGGNNDPQKLKMLQGVVLKLKPLIKLYGGHFNLLALTNALTNARTNALTNARTNALTNAINYINLGNINNVLDVLNNNNALNGINNINDINAIIYILLNYVPAFTFVDINNPFPSFTSSNNTSYVVDVNKSNDLLGNNLQYVPAALFDSNGGNTYDPGNLTNVGTNTQPSYIPETQYDTFVDRVNSYTTNNGASHLGTNYNYKYRRNGCNLEVRQNNPLNNQVNNVLTKADIRCGSQVAIRDNFTIPDDAKNILHVKGYLTQKLRPVVPDDEFIVRMYKVLEKFVRDGNRFAIQKNGNTYSLTLPKYFNNIRSGPGVQDLVFLTILYRLNSITFENTTGDLPLQLIDNIVNLKRVGDYGQVMDAKMANLPFFTTDNMETLMCIIEKVSCYIDFNQGVIIYDNNGGGDDGGFIRSKGKTRDSIDPPGYGRRT